MAARKGGTVSESNARADGRRGVLWVRRYGDLVRHCTEVGMMPREIAHPAGVEVEENRLAGWVRYQRRREERGVMSAWQRQLLGQVPGFSWDPLGEQWDTTCAELCQWPIGNAHGRPAELPAGGHENCPVMANRSAHLVVGGVGHGRVRG